MDKLEDDRRTIAHKHDGTTEDFEEKLHSPEHSQQKRMLNTAWKGETWFKDRSRRMHDHQSHWLQHRQHQTKHPGTQSATAGTSTTEKEISKGSQRGQKRWQQAMSNSLAVNSNHIQQQAFHDQRNLQQQKTIGCVKDICGKESAKSPEQNFTYHNRRKMGQMSQSWSLKGQQQSSSQHQEQDGTGSITIGQRSDKQLSLSHGLAWQTLRRAPHIKMRYVTWMKKIHNKQKSKRTHSTSTTNTTGKSRAWPYTPTFQKLASNMRSQQG